MHSDLLALCVRFSALDSSQYLNSHPCPCPSLSTGKRVFGKEYVQSFSSVCCKTVKLLSVVKTFFQSIFPAINHLVVLCGTAAADLILCFKTRMLYHRDGPQTSHFLPEMLPEYVCCIGITLPIQHISSTYPSASISLSCKGTYSESHKEISSSHSTPPHLANIQLYVLSLINPS